MVVIDLTQRIHKLSTALANQIAAGEVIERPASVVKELLENSLDARATEIRLDIRKGGRLLIGIQDNGCGIHPEDLSLALDQHATSKLVTQADLERINTLGFRGEALSSVASVSRLKLSSRIEEQECGWSIDAMQGFNESKQVPTGMTVGTSVEVRDLFFNTPARRKFLRTDNTEFFHIREIVRRVALSRHDVSFHLKHNNKTILQCVASDVVARVQAIFGQSFLPNAFQLNEERNGLRLWGWLGHPEVARSQMDQQYFYLNGRVIRDKQVNHAVRLATQDHLYTGKHAIYLLFLEMHASYVDVNVHPAKHEVRFRETRDVHDFIYSSLLRVYDVKNIGIETTAFTGVAKSQNSNGLPSSNHYIKDIRGQKIQERGRQHSFSQTQSQNYPQNCSRNFIQSKLISNSGDFFVIEEGRYLITQAEDKIFLLDVLLCNEIIMLPKLKDEYEKGGIRSRPLLVPLTITITNEEGDLSEHESLAFESFGLKIERVAPDSLLIREVPLLLEYADVTKLLREMFSMIQSNKSSQEIIDMMCGHVNDAGLVKIDSDMVGRLLNEMRLNSTAILEKSENCAWRVLNDEILSDLLKRKK